MSIICTTVFVAVLTACGGSGGAARVDGVDQNANAGEAAPRCPANRALSVDPRAACGGTTTALCTADFDGASISNVAAIGSGRWPSWSPDGSKIAFQRSRDDVDEILFVTSDGGGEQRLAAGAQPSWSPDGTRIVYASGEGIATVSVSHGESTTLVRNDGLGRGSARAYAPIWSPDGQRIAFGVSPDSTNTFGGAVFVMDSEGSNLRPVATPATAADSVGFPIWSPDDWVAWVSASHRAIGTAPSTGSNISWFAQGMVEFSRTAWLPAAPLSLIAYHANGTCGPGAGVHLVNVLDESIEPLIKYAAEPAWSADGARLAFVLIDADASPPPTASFPPVVGSAQTYAIEHPDSLGHVSRYVMYDSGAFELQYSTSERGVLTYRGRYARSGSRIDFDFDGSNTAGAWEATGVIDGDRLAVEYNNAMMLADFEDAVYLLDRD